MTAQSTEGATDIGSVDDVVEYLARQVAYGPPRLVGAELEWLLVDRHRPLQHPQRDRVLEALGTDGTLPGGCLLSYEPGGQLELSSPPAQGASAAVDVLAGDLQVARDRMDAAGIALLGMGCDPVRPAVRQLTASRYLTMERFFAALGEPAAQAGRTMMCSTAAVQVSVDAGLPGVGLQSAAARWHRAHAVGPVLVAAFANSPLREGRPTGYRSTRQWNWSRVDPSRTRPPADGQGPVDAMAALALDARVMTIRDADGTCQPAADGLTLRDWMACVPGTRPTTQDLEYHLSTLFPPVRFRGWMEVRYLDALPDPFWQVPVSVVAALMDDDRAADTALEACEGLAGQWLGAAREGTADPVLRRAAQTCLLAAAIALRDGGQPRPAAAVEGYVERWTSRGRTPADDVLDQVTAGVPTHTHLIASE